MPHQCTECGFLFEDGSDAVLNGCPDCNGMKFQFRPPGWEPDETTAQDSAANSTNTQTEDETDVSNEEIIEAPTDEDFAQSSARTDIVDSEELPSSADTQAWGDWPGETTAEQAPDNQSPEDPYEREVWEQEQKEADIEALREELNRQFGSIKILEPGEYELNLMELYDRDEYIIALQEDGKYMIQMPNEWSQDNTE